MGGVEIGELVGNWERDQINDLRLDGPIDGIARVRLCIAIQDLLDKKLNSVSQIVAEPKKRGRPKKEI